MLVSLPESRGFRRRLRARAAWGIGAAAVLVVALVGCSATGLGPGGGAGPDAQRGLRVTSSDSEVEKQLGTYFREVKDWNVEYEVFQSNPDDLYLRMEWSFEESEPNLVLNVDVSPTNGGKDGRPIEEIRIEVAAVFKLGVKSDHPQRAAVLEAINQHHVDYWMPHRLYLDEDGDLALSSSVNIPGTYYAVHPELVADLVIRTVDTWELVVEAFAKRGLPAPGNF